MQTIHIADPTVVRAQATETTNRISREVLDAWRNDLSSWMPPIAFRECVDKIAESISRRTFFHQAGLTFLRDAWIASRVADALSSDLVRLVSNERPDFEIQSDGHIQQFEATEADMEGRRRGAELEGSHIQPDPVENWRKRFEAIPTALDRVVGKKLKKEYPPDVGLVIYVNLGCYGAYLSERLPILREGTAPAKDKFKRIFVLWEGVLYKFWEDGRYALEKHHSARLNDF